MSKLLKTFYTFLVLASIFFLFFFKPLSIYTLENYLSELLTKKVKIQSLEFFPLQMQAYVEKERNQLSAKLLSFHPSAFQVDFKGDVNFTSTLNIIYKEHIYLNIQASAYDSKTQSSLNDLNLDFESESGKFTLKTVVNIPDYETAILDLEGVYKDDELKAKGYAKLSHADLNITNLSSLDDVTKANYILTSKDITYYGDMFELPLQGKLLANGKVYSDEESLKISASSASVGGTLKAVYENNVVDYEGERLHLTKILNLLRLDKFARGYVNGKGKLYIDDFSTDMQLSSPKITFKNKSFKVNSLKAKYKDDKFTIHTKLDKLEHLKTATLSLNGSYKEEFLDTKFKIATQIKKEPFILTGDLKFSDILTIDIHNKNFGATTKLSIKDKKIKFSSNNLEFGSFLNFMGEKEYISGKGDITATGDFNKIKFSLKSKELITDINTTGFSQEVDVDLLGTYDINKEKLYTSYKLQAPLHEMVFKAHGKIDYLKSFSLSAHSSDFDSDTAFYLKNKKIKFHSSKLNIAKLLKALNQPQEITGDIKLTLNGKVDNLNIALKSKNIILNNNNEKIDTKLNINYTPQLIKIRPTLQGPTIKIYGGESIYLPRTKMLKSKHNVKIRYNKEVLLLKLNTNTMLTPPYKTSGSLSRKDDIIDINSFTYDGANIKSDFIVSIKELKYYKALTIRELHGEAKIRGSYSHQLEVTSKSWGGLSKLTFKNNLINIKLDDVQLEKVEHLFGEDALVNGGDIDGALQYNINSQAGTSDIKISKTTLGGINIDKKLSTLNDALGLNIVDLTKSYVVNFKDSKEHTNIHHIQLNLELKDKNIQLQDVALSTDDFRIVAFGKVQESGKIDKLKLSIVDEKGCAVMAQSLQGDIRDPKVHETTTAIVSVVKSVPSSLWGTGVKILDSVTDALDSTAKYTADKTYLSKVTDENINLTSRLKSSGNFLLNNTSDIIMPRGCKVIYKGAVKAPKSVKKDSKKE